MTVADLKRHLGRYSIFSQRRTTINHAFASALAPVEPYNEARARRLIELLGQDPDAPLRCVYCDSNAETWDHVHAIVSGGQFSGAGHVLSNLVPCCKPCNSTKGNKDWRKFVEQRAEPDSQRQQRLARISAHVAVLNRHALPQNDEDYAAYLALRDRVLSLLQEGDILAEKLRAKATASESTNPD